MRDDGMQKSDTRSRGNGNRIHFDMRFVQDELTWRERPQSPMGGSSPRITLSRWTGGDLLPVEASSDSIDPSHIISFSLMQTRSHLKIGNDVLKDGLVKKGTTFISGPTNLPCNSIFYQEFSFLQIYLERSLINEALEYMDGRPPAGDVVLFGPRFVTDATIEHLIMALARLDDMDRSVVPMFMESIGFGLAARLLAHRADGRSMPVPKRAMGLAKWRLDRTTEYIEAHIAEPIRLGDLSAVAGLSRMHFAAQFREATGFTPHTYILLRRIELAKDLLRNRSLSIVDVALATGFSTQAHFSAVFRRFGGVTPRQWRGVLLD